MKKSAPINYPKQKQQDLAGPAPDACPTCGKPWGKTAVKVCRCCGDVIGKRHKWHLVPAGPGTYAIQHIDCDHPEDSRAKVQQRRKGAGAAQGAGDAPARLREKSGGREDATDGGRPLDFVD